MLRRTIEAACYIADVDSAIIALINNQDGTLRIRARGTEDGSVLVSEDAHHLPYLVAGLQKGIPFVLSPAEETVARPTLVIPLFAQGEALGVMAISSQGDPFTPSEQTMLTGLSTYLAAAVASAAQIERTRTTSRELSMLIEASNAIASSLDLGSVLQTTTRHLMRATQAHWCIIADWDRENNRLLTLGEHRDAYWPVAAGRVIDLTASPIREKAVHGGKVYNFSIRDEGLNGQQRMLLEALGVQRVLGLPIQHEGRLVGLVELANIHAHMPYSHSQRNRSIRQVLDLATYLLTHQPSDGSDYLRQAAHNLVAEAAADWATLYYWDRDSDTLVRLLEYGSGIWAGEVTAPVYDLDA
ncbi:MAG: GAF domain-containing protein, partial [Chloroflexi bacterium]|nr:GAF domain-containing protein [Chloroflexota bacterium]